MKGFGASDFYVLRALLALALCAPLSAPVASASVRAETAGTPPIPVHLAQLTISPDRPAPTAPTAQAPRPARPVARPVRPAPARSPAAAPAPVASPPPVATPSAAEQARAANEQLAKRVDDLGKQVADLMTETGNLTAQIRDLNGAVSQLQRQLTDAELRLKEDVDRTAAAPFQTLVLSGAVEQGVKTNIDRLFQSSWPDISVPVALLLLLAVLLGTMIIGIPVKALMRRVPYRREAHLPKAIDEHGGQR